MAEKQIRTGRKPLYDDEIKTLPVNGTKEFKFFEYGKARSFQNRAKLLGRCPTLEFGKKLITITLQK
jgi:hypothetical protein